MLPGTVYYGLVAKHVFDPACNAVAFLLLLRLLLLLLLRLLLRLR